MNNQKQTEYSTAKMAIQEQVYLCLLGELHGCDRLPWVPNLYQPGAPLQEAYGRMYDAYAHLRQRFGCIDEDEDVEIIINALLDYGHILADEMFRCGRYYQSLLYSK